MFPWTSLWGRHFFLLHLASRTGPLHFEAMNNESHVLKSMNCKPWRGMDLTTKLYFETANQLDGEHRMRQRTLLKTSFRVRSGMSRRVLLLWLQIHCWFPQESKPVGSHSRRKHSLLTLYASWLPFFFFCSSLITLSKYGFLKKSGYILIGLIQACIDFLLLS